MSTPDILIQNEVSQDEMLHVVRDYVRVRTGIDTPLHVGSSRVVFADGSTANIPSPLEVQLLHQAFFSACEWFARNRSKIPQP